MITRKTRWKGIPAKYANLSLSQIPIQISVHYLRNFDAAGAEKDDGECPQADSRRLPATGRCRVAQV